MWNLPLINLCMDAENRNNVCSVKWHTFCQKLCFYGSGNKESANESHEKSTSHSSMQRKEKFWQNRSENWKNIYSAKRLSLTKALAHCSDNRYSSIAWSTRSILEMLWQDTGPHQNHHTVALAGNRTRVSRVAGENSTTEPPMRRQPWHLTTSSYR